jgi:hypothetical protein
MSVPHNRKNCLDEGVRRFREKVEETVRDVDIVIRENEGIAWMSDHPRVSNLFGEWTIIFNAAIQCDEVIAMRMLERVRESGERPKEPNPYSTRARGELIDRVEIELSGLPAYIDQLSTHLHYKGQEGKVRLDVAMAVEFIQREYQSMEVEFIRKVQAALTDWQRISDRVNNADGVIQEIQLIDGEVEDEFKPGRSNQLDNAELENVIEKTKNKMDKRAEWMGKALMLRKSNPNMTKAEIATRIGIHPGQLSPSRFPELAELEKMLRGDVKSGHLTKDSESGSADVEAVASGRDEADRGIQIQGSSLYREYCADCHDPIRVTHDQLGTLPRCKDCAG